MQQRDTAWLMKSKAYDYTYKLIYKCAFSFGNPVCNHVNKGLMPAKRKLSLASKYRI